MQITAAVDLGKSRCRVAFLGDGVRTTYTDAGAPGLASEGGVDAAVAAILPLLEKAGEFHTLSVGAAGAFTAPHAAAALARRLSDRTGSHVVVTSDVVTAHIGAMNGAAGTLLIAGTGSVALGIDAYGAKLIDGWGPELGDLGSGSWMGRRGIRATLLARDALATDTALTEILRAHIAPAPDPISWLAEDSQSARRLATVAPLVLNAAQAGDAAASAIVAEAVRLLSASAAAASESSRDVVLHGGLTEHDWFRAQLERALIAMGRDVAPAVGDAFDGALLLARRTDLPHERFAYRAE